MSRGVKDILNILRAYDRKTVLLAVAAWRAEIDPDLTEGLAANVPLAQNYGELTPDALKYLKEEAEKKHMMMPKCPTCGRKLNLLAVCPGCPKGLEGFKSKYSCVCSYEEFFRETYEEKYRELREALNGN